MLDRSAILTAADITFTEVEVPEWGGSVLVRGMTGTERDRYELAALMAKDDPMNKAVVRARLVAWCTCGEDRRPLFTQADVDTLGGKSAQALDRVVDVITRLSGIGEVATEAAEADFDDGQSGASTSAWPGTSGSPSRSSSPDSVPPSSPNGSPTSGSPGLSVPSVPTS